MFKKLVFDKIIPQIYNFYLSVNLKTKELRLSETDKCLCIAPHADDESIGCGGTLSKYTQLFDVICLTKGQGHKTNNDSDIRISEFKNAMKAGGISSFKMLDMHDKSVLCDFEIFRDIDISDYDYIFIPNPLDQHRDHKAVSLLLNKLLEQKKHKSSLKIALYEVWSSLALPNSYVDISDVIETKKAMINSHVSQVATRDYTNKATALNSYRGLHHNIEYAEAFCVIEENIFKKMCKVLL